MMRNKELKILIWKKLERDNMKLRPNHQILSNCAVSYDPWKVIQLGLCNARGVISESRGIKNNTNNKREKGGVKWRKKSWQLVVSSWESGEKGGAGRRVTIKVYALHML